MKDVLTNLIMVNIYTYMYMVNNIYMHQIITLYALNLHNVIRPLYLNKAGKKKRKKKDAVGLGCGLLSGILTSSTDARCSCIPSPFISFPLFLRSLPDLCSSYSCRVLVIDCTYTYRVCVCVHVCVWEGGGRDAEMVMLTFGKSSSISTISYTMTITLAN